MDLPEAGLNLQVPNFLFVGACKSEQLAKHLSQVEIVGLQVWAPLRTDGEFKAELCSQGLDISQLRVP